MVNTQYINTNATIWGLLKKDQEFLNFEGLEIPIVSISFFCVCVLVYMPQKYCYEWSPNHNKRSSWWSWHINWLMSLHFFFFLKCFGHETSGKIHSKTPEYRRCLFVIFWAKNNTTSHAPTSRYSPDMDFF
jgi:hypothetical protein